jgi:starvation-inducible DNA-binding protein
MEPVTAIKNHTFQKIAEELAHFLADTYLLYLKTQNFHWNVRGPAFYSLHKMFEEQYVELAQATDELAERMRALGSIAPATFSEFLKLTSLTEDRGDLKAEEMIKKLVKDHEMLAVHALHILEKAQKVQDEATVDLLIQRIAIHQKTAWMLKSSL